MSSPNNNKIMVIAGVAILAVIAVISLVVCNKGKSPDKAKARFDKTLLLYTHDVLKTGIVENAGTADVFSIPTKSFAEFEKIKKSKFYVAPKEIDASTAYSELEKSFITDLQSQIITEKFESISKFTKILALNVDIVDKNDKDASSKKNSNCKNFKSDNFEKVDKLMIFISDLLVFHASKDAKDAIEKKTEKEELEAKVRNEKASWEVNIDLVAKFTDRNYPIADLSADAKTTQSPMFYLRYLAYLLEKIFSFKIEKCDSLDFTPSGVFFNCIESLAGLYDGLFGKDGYKKDFDFEKFITEFKENKAVVPIIASLVKELEAFMFIAANMNETIVIQLRKMYPNDDDLKQALEYKILSVFDANIANISGLLMLASNIDHLIKFEAFKFASIDEKYIAERVAEYFKDKQGEKSKFSTEKYLETSKNIPCLDIMSYLNSLSTIICLNPVLFVKNDVINKSNFVADDAAAEKIFLDFAKLSNDEKAKVDNVKNYYQRISNYVLSETKNEGISIVSKDFWVNFIFSAKLVASKQPKKV